MVGGLTEFASLAIGIEGLSIIALFIYAAAGVVAMRPLVAATE